MDRTDTTLPACCRRISLVVEKRFLEEGYTCKSMPGMGSQETMGRAWQVDGCEAELSTEKGETAMKKLITARQAVDQVEDGAWLVTSGFQMIAHAEELSVALERRFLETGAPRGLTLMHGGGQGQAGGDTLGLVHYSHENLVGRYICGHLCGNKAMMRLVTQNKLKCYNFPMGVITQLYRRAAAGKKGELTKVGLKTFVDPRQSGGRMNECTGSDLVHLIHLQGEEFLFYDAPKIDVAFIRGTTADENGNISMEEECGTIDALDIAMATRASGGKVFVQVKHMVESMSLPASRVVIPGIFVDGVVLTTDAEKYHRQTPGAFFNPAMAGQYKIKTDRNSRLPLDARKIIARRAAMELRPHSVINLGIGIPEQIAFVTDEEGISDQFVLTIEAGMIGGVPVGGVHFGSAVNHWAAIPMGSQFDFYNSGGLDAAFLGFAQMDQQGNVNASKFGDYLSGCGGFIDISQCTPRLVFCGTLTSGGLEVSVSDGALRIEREGKIRKFVRQLHQITFSAEFARQQKQDIMVITERCVFRLTEGGLLLTEIADGMDVERDVLANMDFAPAVAHNLKRMAHPLFREKNMDLKAFLHGNRASLNESVFPEKRVGLNDGFVSHGGTSAPDTTVKIREALRRWANSSLQEEGTLRAEDLAHTAGFPSRAQR